MNNIKCLECGDLISKRGAKKYCSRECCLKNTSIQKQSFDENKLKGHIPWNKGSKGIMKSNSGSFQKGTQINLGRVRLDMRGENNLKWKPKIEKECSFCKKILFLQPNEIRNRNFCNRSCWALGTRGKESPVYKGEEAVGRYRNRVAELPEYKEWHAIILKRDNYKCVLCESKERLEVDHKKRFLFIVNENNLKTVEDARNCKELWDTDNGRTVCHSCHLTTDTYGTKGLKA